jgi:hypothetical protein
MIPYRASLRFDLASRGLSEPPDSLARNRWTICPGSAGRFGSEQVQQGAEPEMERTQANRQDVQGDIRADVHVCDVYERSQNL